MRRSTLFVGILSLLHATNLWCHCEDDEVTLLQLNRRVNASHVPSVASMRQSALPRAQALLASVQKLAKEATGEDPEVVNTAIQAVQDALSQMQPRITEEHETVQRQIQGQLQEIRSCHTSEGHGATVVTNLQGELGIIQDCRDARDSAVDTQRRVCDEWENHAGQLVFPPCLSSTDSQQIFSLAQNLDNWVKAFLPVVQTMHADCQQWIATAEEERARCDPVINRYEELFCQHFLSCRLLSACHHHEVAVYNQLRTDTLPGQNSRQDQWRIVKQAECILNHITGSVDTNQTVGDANLTSCDDDIAVDHLILTFEEPDHWPECQAPSAGEPQCPPVDLPAGWADGEAVDPEWTLVLQYGATSYDPNAGASGTLQERRKQFAKMSDAAINALPSAGEDAYDYYKLTSESASPGTRDTLFIRVQGAYNDLLPYLGYSSWRYCSAASFDECTWSGSNPDDQYAENERTGGDGCGRWFTGHSGSTFCYPDRMSAPGRRCWAAGHRCSWGSYAIRQDVKMYKKTGEPVTAIALGAVMAQPLLA